MTDAAHPGSVNVDRACCSFWIPIAILVARMACRAASAHAHDRSMTGQTDLGDDHDPDRAWMGIVTKFYRPFGSDARDILLPVRFPRERVP